MLTIKNNYNEKLAGILDTNKNTKELIIICHGSRRSKDGTIQKTLAQNLKDRYNIFRFDFSGNGNSEGKLEDGTYSKDIEDLLTIIEHFTQEEYAIKAIIGHSKSGTEVLLATKDLAEKKVDQIIALAPRIFLSNSNEMIELKKQEEFFNKNQYYIFPSEKGHKITANYINDLKKWWDVTKHYQPSIKTHIIHGTKDQTIDILESESFIKTFKKTSLITINNASHSFGEHLKELTNETRKILN